MNICFFEWVFHAPLGTRFRCWYDAWQSDQNKALMYFLCVEARAGHNSVKFLVKHIWAVYLVLCIADFQSSLLYYESIYHRRAWFSICWSFDEVQQFLNDQIKYSALFVDIYGWLVHHSGLILQISWIWNYSLSSMSVFFCYNQHNSTT